VRADGGTDVHRAVLVAVCGRARTVHVEHLSFSAPQHTKRGALRRGKPIADHVVQVVRVLFDVIPRAAAKLGAIRGEEISPGVGPAHYGVARHHRGNGAEGHAVAGKPGRYKLSLRGFADVGEPVICLDHLARPSVGEREPGQQRVRHRLERRVARAGVIHLTGLVILAAQNGEVIPRPPLDAQVVVRVGRVPVQSLRDDA